MGKPKQHLQPRIGITIGDINGIGPEVIIKALSDNRLLNLFTPIIYGSTKTLAFYRKLLQKDEFNYTQVKDNSNFIPKKTNVVNCWDDAVEIKAGEANNVTGAAALKAIVKATEDLKEGHIDALVTAPINKATIQGEEFSFPGHTEYFTQTFGAEESLMLLTSETLRVGVVTGHIPVMDIPKAISKTNVLGKLKVLEQSLKNDFGITKPKMAVLGLNPHAGEDGLLGKEEEEIIKPCISELKNKGKLVFGPFSADGFFGDGQYKKFDGILAMYHDQGLIPFKTIAFDSGVNYTAGLSVVRTSPDHGTAYSIAGKGIANEKSMREALFQAFDIIKNRKEGKPANQLAGKNQ